MGIYFSYLNDKVLGGLREAIEETVANSDNLYDSERLTSAAKWTTLSHSVSLPEMGDIEQVAAVLDEVFSMVDTIAPVVRRIF